MSAGQVGVAGREKPQDCIVTVEMTDNGGIEINLNSKMEKMFGEAILEAVKEALNEKKVENAKVIVEDFGSLDFAIKARTKTAVARARGDLDE